MMNRNSFKGIIAAALLGAALLMGCSKSERPGDDEGSTPLAIRLSAGLQTLSRATVNNGTPFLASVAGWESSATADYTQAASWQTTSQITASEDAGPILLDEPQTYHQNSAVKTYIRAWHPTGTPVGSKVIFGGDSYRSDGTDDVLLAAVVSGSATDAGVKTLAFSHPLTQLKFVVKGDAAFGTATTVQSISIIDACLPTGIDLATDAVTYAEKALLPVPSIQNVPIIGTPSKTGDPVMVQPFAGNTFRVNIRTSDATYNDVAVTIDKDQAFIPGKAYTITLSFTGVGIGTRAIVTPWDDTGTGSGDIETE